MYTTYAADTPGLAIDQAGPRLRGLSDHYRMVGEAVQGLFIGVGVDKYTGPGLSDLSGSFNEVQAVGGLMGEHFGVHVLRDPDEVDVLQELRDHVAQFSDDEGAAVLMWSGHGIPGSGANTVRLLAHDSRTDPSDGLSASDVAAKLAATGASQILLILDTCYSGNAVEVIAQIYTRFLETPPAGKWCWFGLLAACGPEKVRQHQLGPKLERLLRDGPLPDGPEADDLRRRWSTHRRLIRGDDLWDALITQWDHDAAPTEPKFTTTGAPRPFIRNPLWSPAAGPLTVTEVLTGIPAIPPFFGRQSAVATVSGWQADPSGVCVVTGAAGSGKSALLHHALSRDNTAPTAATDGPAAVIIDVRGLSAEVIAATIDRNLVARGLLGAVAVPRNAFELCGGLQRRRDNGDPVPVIALDALSEAIEPTRVVESLLTPLSSVTTVIVATRPTTVRVPRQRRASQHPQMAAAGETEDVVPISAILTATDRILDLDSPQQQASGWTAIEEMLDDLLPPTGPDHDPAGASVALRRRAAGAGPPPFVLTTLLIDYARHTGSNIPPTPAAIDDSLGAALDELVTRSYDNSTRPAAMALLDVLPYGLGAGIPEREWLAIANATRDPDYPHLDRDDLAATLAPLGAYIVEDSESDEAVYRFAHILIAQHFAAHARKAVGDTLDLQIAGALVEAELAPAGSSLTPPRSHHLDRYLWRYVARVGERGLELLRGNDLLFKDLAAAALAVSIDAVASGSISVGLALAEESTSVADHLTGPDHHRQLAPALAHLATIYQSTGQIARAGQTGRDAVAAYNQLVSEHPAVVVDLAAVAHNLANMLIDAQDTSASAVATQAVTLEQRFLLYGGDNRYRVGIARNTLALALSMEGRVEEALQASRDAVDILQAAVNETGTERDRAALAQALQNLGSHLADRGLFDEAVAVTEEARTIMDDLVAGDASWRPALLETLSDLGVRYLSIGDGDGAMAATIEAIDGYRAMASLTPAEAVNYAGALTNYASILIAADRGEAALDPAGAAVEIMRQVADREVAKRTALALMLDNYANPLSLTGRHSEALEVSEQALQYYRAARDDNPSLDNDVARVLLNYCQRLAASGQFVQAAAIADEAITLFEQLSTSNAHNQVDAVTTRALKAIYTVANGQRDRGVLLAAKAVLQGEQLLADGVMSPQELATVYIEVTKAAQRRPALAVRYAQRAVQLLAEAALSDTPDYATALRNLAALHGMAGQIDPGLTVIADAVALWNQLLDRDGSHRAGLASALGTQAKLQLERGRQAAARDSAIASVQHYRQLPELSMDDIETCGITLAVLARAMGRLDDHLDQLDQNVTQTLENRDGPTRARLLWALAREAPGEHPRVPSWIHRAITELGSADPMLMLHLRRLTRTIRETGRVRFDQLWQRTTGTELPTWATIDQQKIDWALQWVSTPDFTSAEAFLQHNTHLLGEDHDSAIDEASLILDPTRAAALKDIRNRLRFTAPAGTHTVDPLPEGRGGDPHQRNTAHTNIYDLAEHFLSTDLDQRIGLLAQRGEELRSETVGRHLRAHNDRTRSGAAVSLIELSRIPLHTDVAAAATDTDQARAVLARIAEHHDIRTLHYAAVVLMNKAKESASLEILIESTFYVGVSMLKSESSKQGQEFIAGIVDVAPTRVPEWRRLSERLSGAKPEFGQAAGILDQRPEGECD